MTSSLTGHDDLLSLEAIRDIIAAEERADADVLHLTANEAVLSPLAQAALGSPLQNRYLLEHLDMRGDSPSRLGNFLFRGMNGINTIERSATAVCQQMFGAEYAEFRCLSGLHAMQTSIAALSSPGDTVMRVSTKDGGHFLTELICRSFGRQSCTYEFRDVGELDLDRTREVIGRERPTLLYIDAMNYLFPFPLAELKEMIGPAPLVYDASHTLGLIAGGQFQDPLREGADILQANTHKTLFGPQKALVLGNDRGFMERISYTLSNGMVSSQHTSSTLALFVALHEMHIDGRPYAAKVVDNARFLADVLHRRGLPLLAADRDFTRNHMFFVDTVPLGSGVEIMERVLRAGISLNRSIAFGKIEALRIGVQQVTRLGYTDDDLERVGGWLADLILGVRTPEEVSPEVLDLVRSRQAVHYTGGAPGLPGPTPVATVGAASRAVAPGTPTAPPVPSTGAGIVPAGPDRRPRWVSLSMARTTAVPDAGTVDIARELGILAGVFEHQVDSAGNISVQSDGRLFVTASGAYIRDLSSADLVEIVGMDDWTLSCRGGGPPSVEAYLHYLIRQTVPAAVVVHNHYIPAGDLDRHDILVLPPKEYGSVELAEAVAEGATRSQRMYVRRHGLVFWGQDAADCRDMLLSTVDPGSGVR